MCRWYSVTLSESGIICKWSVSYTHLFNIFIGERNYSIACKIAEEYLNKLINMGNGKVTKENIELMNEELRIAKK